MDEMARQIKGKPAIAENAGLEAGRIGHGDDKCPAWRQETCRMAQRPGRPAEVLERMPEDDRRPVPVHVFDLGVADARPGRMRLKTDSITSVAHEGIDKGPVAGSHVENRAGRQDPVQTIRKR